jgi:uncharacterized protein YukE
MAEQLNELQTIEQTRARLRALLKDLAAHQQDLARAWPGMDAQRLQEGRDALLGLAAALHQAEQALEEHKP